ncbi:Kelch-type beta propeller [Cinara cedri]|uniref:Kelch-type beta propeller n=1 Tax=Cinara cedri TaxID=506608 RepID=A0A5E4NLZ3_9HEMI|nr:Kelch-type beta propeller [Cinara cedri]
MDTEPLEYQFKPFVFTLKDKTQPPVDRPLPKVDHNIACNNDFIFSYACGHSLQPLVNVGVTLGTEHVEGSLWKYNFIAGLWENITCRNFPGSLKFNSVLLSGSIIFIHGGKGIRYHNQSKYQTFIGDLSNEHNENGVEFEEIHCTDGIPKNGYGQPIIIDGQYLYSVNGVAEHEHEMDVYRLDLSTKKWKLLYEARGWHADTTYKFKHEVAYYNKKIYMFGGVHFPSTNTNAITGYMNMFQKIHIFDLSSNTWQYSQTVPDCQNSFCYPVNRIHHAWVQCVVQKEFVYMSGGYNGVKSFNDIWRFNLATLEWCLLKSFFLREPTYFHSMTITPAGQLYYYDGVVCKTHLYSYSISPNDNIQCAWISVPKLHAICWDAMLYYFKNQMLKSSFEDLKSLGIPSEYCRSITKAKSLL